MEQNAPAAVRPQAGDKLKSTTVPVEQFVQLSYEQRRLLPPTSRPASTLAKSVWPSGKRESEVNEPSASKSLSMTPLPTRARRAAAELKENAQAKEKAGASSAKNLSTEQKMNNDRTLARRSNSAMGSRAGGRVESRSGSSFGKQSKKEEVEYKVAVKTANVDRAGTVNPIYITLKGTRGSSLRTRLIKKPVRTRSNSQQKSTVFMFSRGTRHVFTISSPDIGSLKSCILEHDNMGTDEGWFCDYVEVTNSNTEEVHTFHCNNWFSMTRADGMTTRQLYAGVMPTTVYRVTVVTGDKVNCGTDARVFLTLFGRSCATPRIELVPRLREGDANKPPFSVAQSDTFDLQTNAVGPITKLRIQHDSSGVCNDWFLDRIVVVDMRNLKWTYYFACYHWLSRTKSDGLTVRELRGSKDPINQNKALVHHYKVTIYTGDKDDCGCDCGVTCNLIGKLAESGERKLMPLRSLFVKSGQDEFMIQSPNLGELKRVRLSHDNQGLYTKWYVRSVVIDDLSANRVIEFPCHDWISKSFGGRLMRDLKPKKDQVEEVDEQEVEIAAMPVKAQTDYEIRVVTGDKKDATTTSDVYLLIHADKAELAKSLKKRKSRSKSKKQKDKTEKKDKDANKQESDVKDKDKDKQKTSEKDEEAKKRKRSRSRSGSDSSRSSSSSSKSRKRKGDESSSDSDSESSDDSGRDEKKKRKKKKRNEDESSESESESASESESESESEGSKKRRKKKKKKVQVEKKARKLELVASERIELVDGEFKRGLTDVFKVKLPMLLSPAHAVTIGIKPRGSKSSWYCDRVVLVCPKSSLEQTFVVDDWLAYNESDRKIERFIKRSSQKYLRQWTMKVYTSDIEHAGTESRIFFTLYGEKRKNTGEVELMTEANKLHRGEVETQKVALTDVGVPSKLRVRSDGKGKAPAWHLKKIELIDENSDTKTLYTFPCDNWLQLNDKEDSLIRELPATGDSVPKPLTATKYIAKVYTGNRLYAAATVPIFLNIFGKLGDTGERPLTRSLTHRVPLRRSKMDEFHIESMLLGAISKIRIGHHDKQPENGWFLDKLVLKQDGQKDEEALTFPCGRWFNSKREDGETMRDLFAGRSDPDVPTTVYVVLVKTDEHEFPGAEANAYVQLIGSGGKTDRLPLTDPEGRSRSDRPSKNGQHVVKFRFTSIDVGRIGKLQLGHEERPSRKVPAWFIEEVVVQERSRGKEYTFPVQKWMNKHDSESELVLEPSDKRVVDSAMQYEIRLWTGTHEHGGTHAKVFVQLFGNLFGKAVKTDRIPLLRRLAKGTVETFKVDAPDVGRIQKLRIGHDNSGQNPKWFLERVLVKKPVSLKPAGKSAKEKKNGSRRSSSSSSESDDVDTRRPSKAKRGGDEVDGRRSSSRKRSDSSSSDDENRDRKGGKKAGGRRSSSARRGDSDEDRRDKRRTGSARKSSPRDSSSSSDSDGKPTRNAGRRRASKSPDRDSGDSRTKRRGNSAQSAGRKSTSRDGRKRESSESESSSEDDRRRTAKKIEKRRSSKRNRSRSSSEDSEDDRSARSGSSSRRKSGSGDRREERRSRSSSDVDSRYKTGKKKRDGDSSDYSDRNESRRDKKPRRSKADSDGDESSSAEDRKRSRSGSRNGAKDRAGRRKGRDSESDSDETDGKKRRKGSRDKARGSDSKGSRNRRYSDSSSSSSSSSGSGGSNDRDLLQVENGIENYWFFAERWLAVDEDDGQIEIELFPATKDKRPLTKSQEIRYIVSVKVAEKKGVSVSDGNFAITLYGKKDDAAERQLLRGEKLDRGIYRFVIKSQDVGRLNHIRLRQNHGGSFRECLVEYVEVIDVKRQKTYIFPCKKWFSNAREEGQLVRDLVPIEDPDLLEKVRRGDDTGADMSREWKKKLHTYKIGVVTGDYIGAETNARVFITLYGRKMDSGSIPLKPKAGTQAFRRGKSSEFQVDLVDIGEIEKVKVWHDNSGSAPGWFLEKVTVDCPTLGNQYTFACGRWLSKQRDDGAIERVIYPQKTQTKRYEKFVPYEVITHTSSDSSSSTTAVPYVCLYGREKCTAQITLIKRDQAGQFFKRGTVDKFVIDMEDVDEPIQKVRVGHNNEGMSPGWKLEKMEVRKLLNDKKTVTYVFQCGKWLDRGRDDRLICRDLVPETVMEDTVDSRGRKKHEEYRQRDALKMKKYQIKVYTGKGGTDADIFLTVFGERGDSGERELDRSENLNKFERNQVDTFNWECADLGKIFKAKVRSSGTSIKSEWLLDKIEVFDVDDRNEKYEFFCERWLSNKRSDAKLEHTLFVKGYRGGDVSSTGTLRSNKSGSSDSPNSSVREPFSKSPSGSRRSDDRDELDGPSIPYTVKVHTGDKKEHGTASPVWVRLTGPRGLHTGKQDLLPIENARFEPGSIETFSFDAPDIRTVKEVELCKDDSAPNTGWFVKRLEVDMPTRGKHIVFEVDQWFARDRAGGKLKRTFYADDETTEKKEYKPRVMYEVKIDTSDTKEAGTDAAFVTLQFFGDLGATEALKVEKNGERFERGSSDTVRLEASNVGKLRKLRVTLGNTSSRHDWLLDTIVVRDTSSGDLYNFAFNDWLSKKKGRGITSVDLPAVLNGKLQLKENEYRISVRTSDKAGAATSAKVFLILFGENGDSNEIRLGKSENNALAFVQNQTDVFTVKILDVGVLSRCRVWHDNSGLGAAWHLHSIEVEDLSRRKKYRFPCDKWLSKTDADRQIVRDLTCEAEQKEDRKDKDTTEYEVEITTADLRGAAMPHNLWMQMAGEMGSSKEIVIENSDERRYFDRGAKNKITLKLRSVGNLRKIHLLGIKRAGVQLDRDDDWLCERICVKDNETGKVYVFNTRSAIRIVPRFDEDSVKSFTVSSVDTQSAKARQETLRKSGLVKYEVKTVTGDKFGAGTNADVFITIYGELGDTGQRELSEEVTDPRKDKFERNQTDTFIIEAADIGEVKKIRIEHNNSGPGPAWYLERVEVCNKTTNETYIFPCAKWLDTGKDDKQIFKELFPETRSGSRR